MSAPDDSAGRKLRGHGVGIAMVAIFAGIALLVAFTASDGAIFGQNLQPAPSGSVPVSDSNAVSISSDAFDEGAATDNSAAPAPPPEDATLSEQERRLLAMRDFPWNFMVGGQIASNQDAFERFEQTIPQHRPVEPGTEPLSLSDAVVVDVDRRDRNSDRSDRDREDSDRDILLVDIIEIDIPLIDNEEQQDDVEEEPEVDQGDSGNNTDSDSSEEGSGEDNSGSGSGNDQSEEQDSEGDSGEDNGTNTSGPSEDLGEGDNTGTSNSTSSG